MDSNLILTILIIVLLIAYTLGITLFVFGVLRYMISEKRKKKFFKALIEGLKTGSITELEDVINIYKGIGGLSSEDLSYRYHLSKQLREFLAELISKNKSVIDSAIDDNMIRDWKTKLSEFIQKNDKMSPYADLPSAERNILSDISIFIENNDIESVKRKTLELAGMIQARNDDFNRIRKINNWTVPLSVIGLVLTIIFGILSIR